MEAQWQHKIYTDISLWIFLEWGLQVGKWIAGFSSRSLSEVPAGNSPAVQWLGLRASTAGHTGLIPGQGTKIPHAVRAVRPPKNK